MWWRRDRQISLPSTPHARLLVPGLWWCKRPIVGLGSGGHSGHPRPPIYRAAATASPVPTPERLSPAADTYARMSSASMSYRGEWRRLYRSEPPRISRDLLIRGIGYRLQEIEHGGLRKSTRRKLKTLAKMFRTDRPSRSLIRPQPEAWRPAGTRMAWTHPHCHGNGRWIRVCRDDLSVAHRGRRKDHRRPLVGSALLRSGASRYKPEKATANG